MDTPQDTQSTRNAHDIAVDLSDDCIEIDTSDTHDSTVQIARKQRERSERSQQQRGDRASSFSKLDVDASVTQRFCNGPGMSSASD